MAGLSLVLSRYANEPILSGTQLAVSVACVNSVGVGEFSTPLVRAQRAYREP